MRSLLVRSGPKKKPSWTPGPNQCQSNLDLPTPGSRLAVQSKRAKGGEAPLPRHSLIPALTLPRALRGAPFWGSRSPLAGRGQRHGLDYGEARLPGVHGPGRRPSLAAPVPAAARPMTAAATPNPGPLDLPAVSPTWALRSRRQRAGQIVRSGNLPGGGSQLCPLRTPRAAYGVA